MSHFPSTRRHVHHQEHRIFPEVEGKAGILHLISGAVGCCPDRPIFPGVLPSAPCSAAEAWGMGPGSTAPAGPQDEVTLKETLPRRTCPSIRTEGNQHPRLPLPCATKMPLVPGAQVRTVTCPHPPSGDQGVRR